MIIAQIGSYPIDSQNIKGGIEASVLGLSRSLFEINHNVYVFDSPRKIINKNYTEEDDGIIIFRFSGSDKNNNFSISLMANAIVEKIQSIKPDVCHIHGSGYLQKNIYKLLRQKRIKCIVTIHGLQNIEKRNELFREKSIKSLLKYIFLSLSEFYIINNSRKIIVDTEYVKQEIIKYKKSHKIVFLPDILVIPQGINKQFYQLKNNPESQNILCVGAINTRKSQKLLIESFLIIRSKVKHVKLVIAGYVSDYEYFNKIRQFVGENKLENDIIFHLDKSIDEIYLLYQDAKIFALHSQEESQGIVLCEAMAAGLPIVSTNVGGIPFVVKNNVNGLISEYNNITDFTSNIINLFRDNNLYETIQKNNKKDSVNFDWITIAKKITELYRYL